MKKKIIKPAKTRDLGVYFLGLLSAKVMAVFGAGGTH